MNIMKIKKVLREKTKNKYRENYLKKKKIYKERICKKQISYV